MRKRALSLFAASLLLLSGCQSNIPSETAAETVIATTASQTSATTAEEATTETERTTAVSEKAPTFSETITQVKITDYTAEIAIDPKNYVDLEKIRGKLSYDLPLPDSVKKQIESEYSGEELEEYRSRNYFDGIYFEPFYIGSEEADWVLEANYINRGYQFNFYIDLLLIKNSEIVSSTGALDLAVCAGEKADDKDLFVPLGGLGHSALQLRFRRD